MKTKYELEREFKNLFGVEPAYSYYTPATKTYRIRFHEDVNITLNMFVGVALILGTSDINAEFTAEEPPYSEYTPGDGATFCIEARNVTIEIEVTT